VQNMVTITFSVTTDAFVLSGRFTRDFAWQWVDW
jgi:hypothetical protein